MAMGDHPDVQFIQAAGYTSGRPDGPPIWIVFHDMEASETSSRAEATAAYFANPGDGRRVSSHYCVDDNSVVQCVRLKDSAWTVGNRPGNYRGINWELSGFAGQVRSQWLDTFGINMFNQMKRICLRDMKSYNIPLRWLTDAQVKSFTPGMTTHNQLRICFGGTTHTDPGPNFPFDYVLKLFQEDDVALKDDPDGKALIERVQGLENMEDPIVFRVPGESVDRKEPNLLAQAVKDMQKSIAELRDVLTSGVSVATEVKLSDEGVQQVKDAVDAELDQIAD